MRCACPQCGSFMIHAETSAACVCPDCLYRCSACLGAGTPLSRDSAAAMKKTNQTEGENSNDR